MRTGTKTCGWPPCGSKDYTLKLTTYHDNGELSERLQFCSLHHMACWCVGYAWYEERVGVDCTEKELADIDSAVIKLINAKSK